jgi:hypothetical protein
VRQKKLVQHKLQNQVPLEQKEFGIVLVPNVLLEQSFQVAGFHAIRLVMPRHNGLTQGGPTP